MRRGNEEEVVKGSSPHAPSSRSSLKRPRNLTAAFLRSYKTRAPMPDLLLLCSSSCLLKTPITVHAMYQLHFPLARTLKQLRADHHQTPSLCSSFIPTITPIKGTLCGGPYASGQASTGHQQTAELDSLTHQILLHTFSYATFLWLVPTFRNDCSPSCEPDVGACF